MIFYFRVGSKWIYSSLLLHAHTCKEIWIPYFVSKEPLYQNHIFQCPPEVGVLTLERDQNSHIVLLHLTFKKIVFCLLLILNEKWLHTKKENEANYQNFKLHISYCRNFNLGRGQNTRIVYRTGVLNAELAKVVI